MKKLLISNWILLLLVVISGSIDAQVRETDKVFFCGKMAKKYKSPTDYSLAIGYVALNDRDLYFEFSGGPNGLTVNEKIPVKSGSRKFAIKLDPELLPEAGTGYKIVLSLREKGGDEKTTKALIVINDIELVNEDFSLADNASFSSSTPNRFNSDDHIDFNIDYLFKDENQIQVSIWDGLSVIASSDIETIAAGSGIKDLKVMLPNRIEGANFRFVLNFGTANDFKYKKTKSEEILGIKFSRPEVYSGSELSKKSVEIYVARGANLLELPGDPTYDFIKIIDKSGKVVSEVFNTDKVNITTLKPETYYVVTGSGYFFKFIKV